MLIEHDGQRPTIAPSAYVAPTAVVVGDVEIGAGSCVLFGAVLSADGGPVVIGRNCVVMENAVIRGAPGHPLRLGDDTLVGPGAHLSGCTVEPGCFLATGVSIFNGATVEAEAEIRINGVLHVNSRLRRGDMIPIGWVGVGDPARILPPDAHKEISRIQRTLDFTKTVFKLPADASQSEVADRYTKRLARHREDVVLRDEPPNASEGGSR